MRIVIAVGGNAIVRESERGTWEEQLANARPVAEEVAHLRADGHELILTHGNGPQVGALHVQQTLAEPEAPALPLHVLGAMTQGELGHLLRMAIGEVDAELETAALLTRVVVDPEDPAFGEPTKPIGRFYDEREAKRLAAERGGHVAPDAGRGWRFTVASPRPLEVLESELIATLAGMGVLVIAAGGGGIPVARSESGLAGVDAVIDKDRCSQVLAVAVDADLLVLLTDVGHVALGFGTDRQRDMACLTAADAARLRAEGEFPPGSIGPKVESAVDFVAGGGRALITSADRLRDAVAGEDGTWIVPEEQGPSAPVEASEAATRA